MIVYNIIMIKYICVFNIHDPQILCQIFYIINTFYIDGSIEADYNFSSKELTDNKFILFGTLEIIF